MEYFVLEPPEGATTKPLITYHPSHWFIHDWTVYMPCGTGYRGTGMSFLTMQEAVRWAVKEYYKALQDDN